MWWLEEIKGVGGRFDQALMEGSLRGKERVGAGESADLSSSTSQELRYRRLMTREDMSLSGSGRRKSDGGGKGREEGEGRRGKEAVWVSSIRNCSSCEASVSTSSQLFHSQRRPSST